MTGDRNTASGSGALTANTTGNINTALGQSALYSNTAGSNNTASGSGALTANTTGNGNTASGLQALYSNTTGGNNTAIGDRAGYTATPANANTTGSNNSFFGYNSGPGDPSVCCPAQRTNATAIGANAVVQADNSVVLGSINGVNGATSSVYVGIGTAIPGKTLDVVGDIRASMNLCIAGDCRTAWPSSGGSGTITGVTAGTGLSGGGTSGTVTLNNTGALSFNGRTGVVTPATGDYSFSQISGSAADGQLSANVALKNSANIFTNTQTVSSGNLALPNTTSASSGVITFGGIRFLHNFGTNNTFVGQYAGNFTMTGSDNTASGTDALFSNTTGFGNTASGTFALNFNTTGSNNTASGIQALYSNTTGNDNTASGYNALYSNTGNNNIAIGSAAGQNATTGSNHIYIGNQGVAGEGTTTRIGTVGTQTKAFIAGISGVTTGGSGVAVLVDSNGQLGTVSSSQRFK